MVIAAAAEASGLGLDRVSKGCAMHHSTNSLKSRCSIKTPARSIGEESLKLVDHHVNDRSIHLVTLLVKGLGHAYEVEDDPLKRARRNGDRAQ